jgi:hypothetical protein
MACKHVLDARCAFHRPVEGGKKLCGALNKGDVVRYRVGLCFIYDARVAAKGDVAGSVWLHAVDVARNLIRPVSVRES